MKRINGSEEEKKFSSQHHHLLTAPGLFSPEISLLFAFLFYPSSFTGFFLDWRVHLRDSTRLYSRVIFNRVHLVAVSQKVPKLLNKLQRLQCVSSLLFLFYLISYGIKVLLEENAILGLLLSITARGRKPEINEWMALNQNENKKHRPFASQWSSGDKNP